MKIAFVSNLFNHHQKFLSDALFEMTDCQYRFVATMAQTDELKNLGYQQYSSVPYIINAFEQEEREAALNWIAKSDVVISGSAPKAFTMGCDRKANLHFAYSERPLKARCSPLKYIPRLIKWRVLDATSKDTYLLCASAFTSADYAKFGMYRHKTYKWGYFPETKHYKMNALYEQKDKQKILWVGRFLDWKHPDDVLRVAKRLKEDGYRFSMDIAGTGEMEAQLKSMAEVMGINDCVTFLGPVPSDRVRELMEKAGIYLFTSDRYEGWGAVLNEAMNSGCAVVASHAIGSVPFLLKDGENGFIYRNGDINDLYQKIKYLLDNPGEQERLGKVAYETIVGEWNAEVAAERLINLSEHLLAGEKYPDLYPTGPCSRAEIIKDDWFYEYRTATL